jgi:hypothetical protein
MFSAPLAYHGEQPLALGAGNSLHEVHAINARRLAEQPEDPWDRGANVGSFQQQAAGARRGREQPLARLQRLVDVGDRFRAGRRPAMGLKDGDIGGHGRKSTAAGQGSLHGLAGLLNQGVAVSAMQAAAVQ